MVLSYEAVTAAKVTHNPFVSFNKRVRNGAILPG